MAAADRLGGGKACIVRAPGKAIECRGRGGRQFRGAKGLRAGSPNRLSRAQAGGWTTVADRVDPVALLAEQGVHGFRSCCRFGTDG